MRQLKLSCRDSHSLFNQFSYVKMLYLKITTEHVHFNTKYTLFMCSNPGDEPRICKWPLSSHFQYQLNCTNYNENVARFNWDEIKWQTKYPILIPLSIAYKCIARTIYCVFVSNRVVPPYTYDATIISIIHLIIRLCYYNILARDHVWCLFVLIWSFLSARVCNIGVVTTMIS